MSNSVTFIAIGHLAPGGSEDLQRYVEGVMPMMLAAGGQPKMRARQMKTLIGEKGPDTVIAMDFPNAEAVEAVLESDAYKALLPARRAGFAQLTAIVAELA